MYVSLNILLALQGKTQLALNIICVMVVRKGIKKGSLVLCLMQDGVGERYEELQLLLQIVPKED